MNVLFVVSDDLTNNALGCYGSPVASRRTSTSSRRRACGSTGRTASSRCATRAGRRSSPGCGRTRPGCYENATQFRKNIPDAQTLPQTFRKAGYYRRPGRQAVPLRRAAGIGTDGLDDPPSWENVVNPRGRDKDDEEKDLIFTLNPMARAGPVRRDAELAAPPTAPTTEQTDGNGAAETIKLLEANKDRPFFLACGFYRPHTPYVAPKKYFEMYPTEGIKLPEVPADHRQSAPAPAFGSAKQGAGRR